MSTHPDLGRASSVSPRVNQADALGALVALGWSVVAGQRELPSNQQLGLVRRRVVGKCDSWRTACEAWWLA